MDVGWRTGRRGALLNCPRSLNPEWGNKCQFQQLIPELSLCRPTRVSQSHALGLILPPAPPPPHTFGFCPSTYLPYFTVRCPLTRLPSRPPKPKADTIKDHSNVRVSRGRGWPKRSSQVSLMNALTCWKGKGVWLSRSLLSRASFKP